MPIYVRFTEIKGRVDAQGTNFLTKEPVGRVASRPGVGMLKSSDGGSTWQASGPIARPKIKVFICPSDPSVVQISRISLTPGGGGVEGRDLAARTKIPHLLNTARSQGPSGKLYIATDTGVYQNGNPPNFDGQGRLLVGTEGGIWRSGPVQEAARRMGTSNNLKQLGLGCHSFPSAEIIVCDAAGAVIKTFLLRNVLVSRAQTSDGALQRSRVTTLTVTFSQVVV